MLYSGISCWIQKRWWKGLGQNPKQASIFTARLVSSERRGHGRYDGLNIGHETQMNTGVRRNGDFHSEAPKHDPAYYPTGFLPPPQAMNSGVISAPSNVVSPKAAWPKKVLDLFPPYNSMATNTVYPFSPHNMLLDSTMSELIPTS